MILKPLQKQYRYMSENGSILTHKTERYTVLNSAIKEYCEDYIGGSYLEIGVNYGHSAYCAWQSFQPNEMVLCDIFPKKNMIPIVERTLNVIDCKSIVTFVYGDTKKTLKHVKHRFDDFDVILVDGDHSKQGAEFDLEFSWNMLKPGGLLLFDDIEIPHLKHVINTFRRLNKDQIDMFKMHEEFKRGIAVLKKGLSFGKANELQRIP